MTHWEQELTGAPGAVSASVRTCAFERVYADHGVLCGDCSGGPDIVYIPGNTMNVDMIIIRRHHALCPARL